MKIGIKNYIEILGDDPSKYDWSLILYNHTLSMELMNKFKDQLDWYMVCTRQSLTEKFMEQNHKYLRWYIMQHHQRLSESFMTNHMDKLDNYLITKLQETSDEFCKIHNIQPNILRAEYQCGIHKKIMYIKKDNPEIIYIGGFVGTRKEAISNICITEDWKSYAKKINKCFNL